MAPKTNIHLIKNQSFYQNTYIWLIKKGHNFWRRNNPFSKDLSSLRGGTGPKWDVFVQISRFGCRTFVFARFPLNSASSDLEKFKKHIEQTEEYDLCIKFDFCKNIYENHFHYYLFVEASLSSSTICRYVGKHFLRNEN